jgi:hypothetical protein
MAALLLLLGVLLAQKQKQKQKQVVGFGSSSNWKKKEHHWSILPTHAPTESGGGFDQIDPGLVEHAHANG